MKGDKSIGWSGEITFSISFQDLKKFIIRWYGYMSDLKYLGLVANWIKKNMDMIKYQT
jgi:hypothetical protein